MKILAIKQVLWLNKICFKQGVPLKRFALMFGKKVKCVAEYDRKYW